MKKCIIIANGKAPRKSIIDFLKKENYSAIICADGGADTARKLGVIPDYIIGDLDSIGKDTLKYFSGKSRVIKIKGQDDTDVEKCLKFAISKGIKEAVLVGVTGDRLDHTFCNLGIILKYFEKMSLKIIAERSLLVAFGGNIVFPTMLGETISIYGISTQTKITSSGLKYPLKNTALPFGKKESTSNAAIAKTVSLKIKNGLIFVIRDFNTVKNNGHF